MTARIGVGQEVRVYQRCGQEFRSCSLGAAHTVNLVGMRILTITAVQRELVPFHAEHGDVLYAVDRRGRAYRKEPHWDGPRASAWVLLYPVPRLPSRWSSTWTQYPPSMSFDVITGRKIA